MAAFQVPPIQRVQMPNFAQALMQAQQIKGMQIQNKLAEAAMSRQSDLTAARQNYLAAPDNPQTQNGLAALAPADPAFARVKAERAAQMDQLGASLKWAKSLPPDQLPGALEAIKSENPIFDDDDVAKIIADPAMLDFGIARAMGIKGVFEAARDERDFQQRAAEFEAQESRLRDGQAESARHNRATEGHAAARLEYDRSKPNAGVANVQAKSQFYQRALGVDAETANKIAGGVYRVVSDPMGGGPKIIDLTTGSLVDPAARQSVRRPGAPALAQQAPPEASRGAAHNGGRPGQDMPPNTGVNARGGAHGERPIDMGDAYGARASGAELLGDTVGQIAPSLVDKDVVRARTAVKLAQGSFMRAFAKNPRLPVYEQERLAELFPKPGAFTSPQSARVALDTIRQELAAYRDDKKRIADDHNLPADQRKQAIADLATYDELESALSRFDIGGDGGANGEVTAVNPETGERLILKDGRWQTAQ